MITIDDPKVRDVLKNYKGQEAGVLGLVVLSIIGTILLIAQNGWMGSARSVYTVALIWIIVASMITYIITVREIERIQETQQSLEFNAHNILAKENSGDALRELSRLAKKANKRANGIARVVYGLGIYSLIFGAANVVAGLSVDAEIIGSIRSIQSLIAAGVRLFNSSFETAHTKSLLLDGAIFGQIFLVGYVVSYDYLLHKMNHEMKRAYKSEVFTDEAATLLSAENPQRRLWLLEIVRNVRSVKVDLEIASLSLIAIDCPVTVGVGATAILEGGFVYLGLPDSLQLFAIGISTGALALHIIAANVMFMILPRINMPIMDLTRAQTAPEGAAS